MEFIKKVLFQFWGQEFKLSIGRYSLIFFAGNAIDGKGLALDVQYFGWADGFSIIANVTVAFITVNVSLNSGNGV